MLTVPIVEKLKSSVELAVSVAGGLLVAFIVMYFAITYALFVTIVRPLRDLAIAAKDASVSTNSRMVMASSGASELQDLADSIRRLRESLLKSLRRLSSGDSAPQN
jgi:HAMP domain-containing protein